MSIPSVNFETLTNSNNKSSYKREVNALARACSQWGFVYLSGVDKNNQFSKIFKVTKDFFAESINYKLKFATSKYNIENQNRYRGYFPTSQAAHSIKEGFEIGWEKYQLTNSGYIFDEHSVYPEPEPFSGWSSQLNSYFSTQLEIGNTLLRAFETYFNLEDGYFTSKFENTLSTLRLLHYPRVDDSYDSSKLESDGKNKFAAPSHTDSGIITLLLQDQIGGLEVKGLDGNWVSAPPKKDSLVMNIGDLLEIWTAGEFKATEHRIRAQNCSRYSIPFFFEPEGKAKIEPFEKKSNFEVLSYESYLNEKFQSFVEYQPVAN